MRKLIVGSALVLVAALAQAAERGLDPAEQIARPARPRYAITGRVVGLFPGARTTMRLTVRNPNPYPIKVRRIRTTVGSRVASCPARTVRVARFRGVRRVPARSGIHVRVRVRMIPTAPDSCAGRRYRLSFRGSGTRA
jgi:hypothetical protein